MRARCLWCGVIIDWFIKGGGYPFPPGSKFCSNWCKQRWLRNQDHFRRINDAKGERL